eukprot:4267708-Amphidinium_carterae.1
MHRLCKSISLLRKDTTDLTSFLFARLLLCASLEVRNLRNGVQNLSNGVRNLTEAQLETTMCNSVHFSHVA